MRSAMLVIAVVLIEAAACGALGRTSVYTEHGVASPGTHDLHPGHEVLWSQLPSDTSTVFSAQFAPDDPFHAELATDFPAVGDIDVTHIHWWGHYWGGRDRLEPTLSARRISAGPIGERQALDCSDAVQTGVHVVFSDNTTGGPMNVSSYSCAWKDYSGPEHVYSVQIPFDGMNLRATLSDMTADLDLLLLSECDENECLFWGDDYLNISFASHGTAGTWYIVVEGIDGAEGSYTLTLESTTIPSQYFAIRFYADQEIGRDRSLPGEMLYEYFTADYNEEWDEDLGLFSYWADIDAFPLVEAHRYWISIQTVTNLSSRIQYGWASSSPVWREPPVMDFEMLEIPRWTSLPDIPDGSYLDLAFELSAIDTPVERRSWGVIKSLYR
jgi:hypothetical protein